MMILAVLFSLQANAVEFSKPEILDLSLAWPDDFDRVVYQAKTCVSDGGQPYRERMIGMSVRDGKAIVKNTDKDGCLVWQGLLTNAEVEAGRKVYRFGTPATEWVEVVLQLNERR